MKISRGMISWIFFVVLAVLFFYEMKANPPATQPSVSTTHPSR